jgi:hypothetical protein
MADCQDNADPAGLGGPGDRTLPLAVFLIGFVSLGYELVQVRMLSFFLGSISSFLAIPIALFGLALGSLYCHMLYRGDLRRLVSTCLLLVFPLMTAVLIAFFAVADSLFPMIHFSLSQPGQNAARLLVYSGLFLPPYFVFGAALSAVFSLGAARIGRLYFFDLSGAAAGCFAVPLLLTCTDLPAAIVTLLLFALMLVPLSRAAVSRIAFGAGIAIFAVVLALAWNGAIFREHPVAAELARTLLKPDQAERQAEVLVRWNEIARTSLVRGYPVDAKKAEKPKYVVVQDDGISNVQISAYDPNTTHRQAASRSVAGHAMPFALGLRPQNILVVFAGVGRDMLLLDALAEHEARITGVELNPAVVDFATHPILEPMRLAEFFSRPGIDLVAREGRDFLNTSRETHDLIFVSTNGSVHANRTGHTRKYLDTCEAMSAYLDRLADDGVLFFWNQPIEHKLVSLRRLLIERGRQDPGSAIYAYGDPRIDSVRSLLVKPSGLAKAEVEALDQQIKRIKKKRLLFAPGSRGIGRFKSIVAGAAVPGLSATPITDDNPFTNKVELTGFRLFPGKAITLDHKYASDWIKILTVLVFTVLSLAVLVALRLLAAPERKLPLPWLAYFFVSGVGYMGVQIGLIGKIELFVGNPLYAVAVILAVFLLANACGAMLQDRFGVMRGWKSLLLLTTAAVGWSVAAAAICNSLFLSLPLPAKVLAVGLAVAPAGLCLGMYFPLGVASMAKAGRPAAVPAAYAVATLSSVVGSAVAMTAIVNYGFSTVVACGAACYAAVAFLFVAARRFAR